MFILNYFFSGESILLFLVQTVGRQTVEHRQFRASWRAPRAGTRTGSSGTGSAASNQSNNQKQPTSINSAQPTQQDDRDDGDTPEHDLEPPRFARKALIHLLGYFFFLVHFIFLLFKGKLILKILSTADWAAVEAALMCGASELEGGSSSNTESPVYHQSGTTLLDKFTHMLIVKCNTDVIFAFIFVCLKLRRFLFYFFIYHQMQDMLLRTLIREQQNDSLVDAGRAERAHIVARRFIRSVVRIYVIFSIETAPGPFASRGCVLQQCIDHNVMHN